MCLSLAWSWKGLKNPDNVGRGRGRGRQQHLHFAGQENKSTKGAILVQICQSSKKQKELLLLMWIHACRQTLLNSVPQHWCRMCSQSFQLELYLKNTTAVGLFGSISSTLTSYQTCSAASVSPSLHLFSRRKFSAAIHISLLCVQTLKHKCPQCEGAAVSSCCSSLHTLLVSLLQTVEARTWACWIFYSLLVFTWLLLLIQLCYMNWMDELFVRSVRKAGVWLTHSHLY